MILSDPLFWLLLLLISPLLGATLAYLMPREWCPSAARAASILAAVSAIALLALSAQGRWLGFLGLDSLSDVMIFLVAWIYAASTWYSAGYLKDVHESFLTSRAYYSLLGAFAFAMLITLAVADLGLMWLGVEGTTVASALLIVLERKPSSVEAAWRYTIIASSGLAVALLAIVMLFEDAGTLDAFVLAANPPAYGLRLALVVGLALVGYGTKVGLFPMHTWLPDAHSESPSPVSALFSGVLLPTALYAFLRVYVLLPVGTVALRTVVIVFGLVSALVAAFLLQRQRSYKRLLAYSSMENMGLVVVGVGLGGIAVYGALLLIVAHAFAKSAAFYCAGNVLRVTGTNQIAQISSLRRRMPWTAAVWVMSSFAVTGAPPFGTFLAEFLLVIGSVAAGQYWVTAGLLVAMLVAFLGLNHQIGQMVFGGEEQEVVRSPEPIGGVAIPLLNVTMVLALGIVALPYLSEALHIASGLLGGGP